MADKNTLISVIIPVYNGERYLGEAIEGVLAQDYRPIEVIVVNDGSTDNTETVAKRYHEYIRYDRQENRGPGAARNRGLGMARGEIVGFLDADDLWPENKLSLQCALIKDPASFEIAVGLTQKINMRGGGSNEFLFEKWLDPYFLLSLGAALFRKSLFKRIGLFDETLHYGEDVDWFMRAREQGTLIAVMEHVTLFYRIHDSNMTKNTSLRDSYLLKAFKKSLDRRRLEGSGSAAPVPRLTGLETLMKHPAGTANRSRTRPG